MKFFILCFILTKLLFANNYELKLYEHILPSIFKGKILIYTDSKSKEILENSKILTIVDKCSEANLLIGKNFNNLDELCKKTPLFTTSYKSYKNNKDSFGAFYWRKGRPQLKFKKDVIEKLNFILPNNLQKYVK